LSDPRGVGGEGVKLMSYILREFADQGERDLSAGGEEDFVEKKEEHLASGKSQKRAKKGFLLRGKRATPANLVTRRAFEKGRASFLNQLKKKSSGG